MSSAIGKRKPLSTLDDGGPPPNISIGEPTDPEEKKRFQDRLRLIQQQADMASREPFYLKPHTLKQPLNLNSSFSVSSLMKNEVQKPAELSRSPPISRSTTSQPVPQFVSVPISCIGSRSCSSAFPLKIEGLRMNSDGSGRPGGVSLKPSGSSLTTPIPFISCSPNGVLQANVSPLPQVFSPMMPVQSISPLALTTFTPGILISPPNAGTSPHSIMANSDASSGYRTGSTSSKGQRSEYTVGQHHPKPNYLRVEEGDSEEEYFEDSSSSGRVTPANGDEDDLDCVPISIDGPPDQPVKTDGQCSSSGDSGGSDGGRSRLNAGMRVEEDYRNSESIALTTTYATTKSTKPVYAVSLSSPVTKKEGSQVGDTHQGSGTGERPSSGVSSMSSDASIGSFSPDLKSGLSPPSSSLTSEVFCHVPGRLSLLSATPKYKVTVEEIKRRLSFPESLNASILGGILRRAKSKNGGHLLRQKLESIGVKLPPGKRKTSELTLLTALVEGEARHLASDYQRVTQRDFPSASIAQHIAKKRISSHPNSKDHIRAVKAAKHLLKELLSLIQPTINVREWPENSDQLAQGLTRYSLLTHSFGPLAMTTALDATLGCLDNLQAIYEGKHTRPLGEPSQYFPHHHHHQLDGQPQVPMEMLPLATREQILNRQNTVKCETSSSSNECPIVMPTHFE